MKNPLSILTVTVIGALLLSACAQQANAQPARQPGEVMTQVPEVSTAMPGISGQPLSQVTPETPTPVVNTAGGQVTVTRDFQGQTITLAVGESFLLKLGEEYTWEIIVSDESVVSRAKNIAVIRGAQGVYDALKTGTVTVSAMGDPLCRQSKPACGMPSVQMDFTVIVK